MRKKKVIVIIVAVVAFVAGVITAIVKHKDKKQYADASFPDDFDEEDYELV